MVQLSSLISLPPEIQIRIARNLSRRSLSSLKATCRLSWRICRQIETENNRAYASNRGYILMPNNPNGATEYRVGILEQVMNNPLLGDYITELDLLSHAIWSAGDSTFARPCAAQISDYMDLMAHTGLWENLDRLWACMRAEHQHALVILFFCFTPNLEALAINLRFIGQELEAIKRIVSLSNRRTHPYRRLPSGFEEPLMSNDPPLQSTWLQELPFAHLKTIKICGTHQSPEWIYTLLMLPTVSDMCAIAFSDLNHCAGDSEHHYWWKRRTSMKSLCSNLYALAGNHQTSGHTTRSNVKNLYLQSCSLDNYSLQLLISLTTQLEVFEHTATTFLSPDLEAQTILHLGQYCPHSLRVIRLRGQQSRFMPHRTGPLGPYLRLVIRRFTRLDILQCCQAILNLARMGAEDDGGYLSNSL